MLLHLALKTWLSGPGFPWRSNTICPCLQSSFLENRTGSLIELKFGSQEFPISFIGSSYCSSHLGLLLFSCCYYFFFSYCYYYFSPRTSIFGFEDLVLRTYVSGLGRMHARTFFFSYCYYYFSPGWFLLLFFSLGTAILLLLLLGSQDLGLRTWVSGLRQTDKRTNARTD